MRVTDSNSISAIQNLRSKGIKVVIATDNMDTFRRFTIPAMGLEKYFDGFLISNELCAYKYQTIGKKIPFFDEYLMKNDLTYSDIVLLDDCQDKTGIYKELGFEIELIKSPMVVTEILRKYSN